MTSAGTNTVFPCVVVHMHLYTKPPIFEGENRDLIVLHALNIFETP